MSILLSAGHSPDNPGACNDNGICEWQLANDWIHHIYYQLLPFVEVEFVDRGDLNTKIKCINSNPTVEIAVELHFNSNIKNAKGSETLYYPGSEKGKELALTIQRYLHETDAFLPNRGAKEGWYQSDPKKGALAFLRKTKCLSVIIEPEFISNLDKINEGKMKGCRAISDALLIFYEKNYKPTFDYQMPE